MSFHSNVSGITVMGPTSITVPGGAMGGDDDVFAFTTVCASRGLFVKKHPSNHGYSYITGIQDQELLTPTLVFYLLTKGCEVFGYKAFLKVDPKGTVPNSFPGKEEAEVEGDSVTMVNAETWEDWAKLNGQKVIVVKDSDDNDEYWIKLVSNGVSIAASHWGKVKDNEIKSLHEMRSYISKSDLPS